MNALKPLTKCKLYAFVDTGYLHGRSAVDVAHELCAGGADIVQLRAKDCSPDKVQLLAEAIRPITTATGVRLVVNDYPAIAVKVGAELCHLGQEDFFDSGHTDTASLRRRYPGLGIGLSTHAPEQAQRALAAAPDYIAIGPVYPTPTKPGAKPVTLDYVRWASVNVAIPWFAIGGINLQNLDEVLSAGARRVCVVSAILNAKDITGACRAFRDRL